MAILHFSILQILAWEVAKNKSFKGIILRTQNSCCYNTISLLLQHHFPVAATPPPLLQHHSLLLRYHFPLLQHHSPLLQHHSRCYNTILCCCNTIPIAPAQFPFLQTSHIISCCHISNFPWLQHQSRCYNIASRSRNTLPNKFPHVRKHQSYHFIPQGTNFDKIYHFL